MKYFVRVYRYVDYEYDCHNIYPLDQYFLKVCTYDCFFFVFFFKRKASRMLNMKRNVSVVRVKEDKLSFHILSLMLYDAESRCETISR